jgi:hypothetical protein
MLGLFGHKKHRRIDKRGADLGRGNHQEKPIHKGEGNDQKRKKLSRYTDEDVSRPRRGNHRHCKGDDSNPQRNKNPWTATHPSERGKQDTSPPIEESDYCPVCGFSETFSNRTSRLPERRISIMTAFADNCKGCDLICQVCACNPRPISTLSITHYGGLSTIITFNYEDRALKSRSVLKRNLNEPESDTWEVYLDSGEHSAS